LSQGGNLAGRGPLATVSVGVPLVKTQKKMRNDGESGCGWLYRNSASPEYTLKNAKKQPTENQKNTKTET